MKVSFLCATRNRFKKGNDLLKDSFDSIVNTIDKDKHKYIEFLARFDDDDNESLNNFVKYTTKKFPEVSVKCIIGKRYGYINQHKYINELCRIASGDLLWLWNDDVIIDTDDWYDTLYEQTNAGKDFKLWVCYSNMQSYSWWYWGQACFPIIPMSWYKVTKRFSPIWSCDTPVQMIAHSLDIYKYIDIFLIHDRPDLTNNQKGNDRTYQEGSWHAYDHSKIMKALPQLVEDIFKLNDEFDLIDTPLQGQFPDWYVENLNEYKYLKQGREL